MDKFEITGGRVIFPDGIREAVVRVENGKIAYVGSERKGYDAIDAGGRYVSPGFIEMHIHGGGATTFSTRRPKRSTPSRRRTGRTA